MLAKFLSNVRSVGTKPGIVVRIYTWYLEVRHAVLDTIESSSYDEVTWADCPALPQLKAYHSRQSI